MLSKSIYLLIAVLFLTSCAKTAPELPEDYGSVDKQYTLSESDFNNELLKLSCRDIEIQLKELSRLNEENVDKINATRQNDQAAAYAAIMLFPPIWGTITDHEETKDKIDEVYKQMDNLYKLQSYKKCNL